MPTFIQIFGYHIYFWSNEGAPLEPVHVHISEDPSPKATKVWILSDGSLELENNNSNIKSHELKRLMQTIENYSEDIVKKWESYFNTPAIFKDTISRGFSR